MQPVQQPSKANGKPEQPKPATEQPVMEAAGTPAADGPPARVTISGDDRATILMADDAIAAHQRALGARYAAWRADEAAVLEQLEKATQDLNALVKTVGKKHGLFNDNVAYHFDIKSGAFTRR